MGLKYGLDGALIGFIDCMFGLATFIYLNVQEYRHMRLGSFEEVVMSYVLGAFGFFKGLALCLTTSQAMVNQGRASIARFSCTMWFLLTVLQIGFIFVMLYYFLCPIKGQLGSDIFLFVIRIVHVAFILASVYLVYKLWKELDGLVPRIQITRKESSTKNKNKQPSKVHWNLKRANKKTRTSAAHTDPNPPETTMDGSGLEAQDDESSGDETAHNK